MVSSHFLALVLACSESARPHGGGEGGGRPDKNVWPTTKWGVRGAAETMCFRSYVPRFPARILRGDRMCLIRERNALFTDSESGK